MKFVTRIYIPKELKEDVEEEIEEEIIEEEEKILFINLEEEAWRREELNIRGRNKKEIKEDIPKEYKNFKDQVFNKAIFNWLPDQSK